ncbi:MAG: hypothetical protein CFE38_09445 [Comamonadaceae bacterium PBBC1]|nr:MAG: hypothetical protein CFE38_09445 [Comamonadaceae bacterium PBBC1]
MGSRAARSKGLNDEVTVKTLKHVGCQDGGGPTDSTPGDQLGNTNVYFRRDLHATESGTRIQAKQDGFQSQKTIYIFNEIYQTKFKYLTGY